MAIPGGIRKWLIISLIATVVAVLSFAILDTTAVRHNMGLTMNYVITYVALGSALSLGLSCVVSGVIMLRKLMAVEPAGKAVLFVFIGIFIMGIAIYGACAIDVRSIVKVDPDVNSENMIVENGTYETRIYDDQGNVLYDSDGQELWVVCDINHVVEMKDGCVVYSRSNKDQLLNDEGK